MFLKLFIYQPPYLSEIYVPLINAHAHPLPNYSSRETVIYFNFVLANVFEPFFCVSSHSAVGWSVVYVCCVRGHIHMCLVDLLVKLVLVCVCM